MAQIDILLQGLKKNDRHDVAVKKLLQLPNIESYLFGLAFVRSGGVENIKNELAKVSAKALVFIGIRNGVTSIQSIFSLFKIGIAPYVVDTASNSKLFHLKIYAAYNKSCAHIILGSANLTHGGLTQNIEASSHIKLNRKLQSDEKYLHKLIQTITDLPNAYPNHIFRVNTTRQAVQLLREGRLEDERLTKLPSTIQKQKNKARDGLQPIPTHIDTKQIPHKGARKRRHKNPKNTAILVWESKPLTRRSLNIPRARNTNITGDINLGQGLMEDMDFQHYFREVVFSDLDWKTSPHSKNPYLERTEISAEIIIKNLSYGVYRLKVTHDPRVTTTSYKQKNTMTKIKWGDARSIISQQDLLGRSLKLYKKNSIDDFLIIID